jgi:hypothetical protein
VMGMMNIIPFNNAGVNQSNPGPFGPWMMGNNDNGRGMMGNNYGGRGMMGGNYTGRGMMGGYDPKNQTPSSDRITIDEAVRRAQAYTATAGPNLEAAEIMEFSNNFYVAVVEKDSRKAAFEVLVDPYSGSIFPEYGPNMMWNVKYGHMGNGSSQENTITFAQAQANAQEFLDVQVPGARVEPDGFTFYGYYTFDFKINDQITGMLSVNGYNGLVWLHTWHGQYISEKALTD